MFPSTDRILLVEDDLLDLDMMLQALATNRLLDKIDVVRDGGEALDYLLRRDGYEQRPEGNPGMILLDLQLPKIAGLDLLSLVRTTPALCDIPVIIVSNFADESHIVRSHQLGVDGYIQKPSALHEYVKMMAQVRLFWALCQPVRDPLQPARQALPGETGLAVTSSR